MRRFVVFALLASLSAGGMAVAAEKPDLDEVMARLQRMEDTIAQQNKRIVEQDKQLNALKGELTAARSLVAPTTGPSDDEVKALIRQELRARPANGMPVWADGLTFEGRMLIEYEGIMARTEDDRHHDRHHGLYELEFGFEKAITEELKAGFGLASGDDDSASDIGQDLGDDGLARDDIWIDKAYIEYTPNAIPGLHILGGKIENCLDPIETQIVWDADINPEAACVLYEKELSETTKAWGILGYIDYFEFDRDTNADWAGLRDIAGILGQVGFDTQAIEGLDVLGYATYYEFLNGDQADQIPVPGLIDDYDMLSLSGQVGFDIAEDIPFALFGETVCNLKDSGSDGQDFAWTAGVKLNEIKKKGDWEIRVDWAEVQMHSIPHSLGHDDRGFSNYRGPSASIGYGLFDNTTLSGTVYCMDRIDDAYPDYGNDEFLTQVDLEVVF